MDVEEKGYLDVNPEEGEDSFSLSLSLSFISIFAKCFSALFDGNSPPYEGAKSCN